MWNKCCPLITHLQGPSPQEQPIGAEKASMRSSPSDGSQVDKLLDPDSVMAVLQVISDLNLQEAHKKVRCVA